MVNYAIFTVQMHGAGSHYPSSLLSHLLLRVQAYTSGQDSSLLESFLTSILYINVGCNSSSSWAASSPLWRYDCLWQNHHAGSIVVCSGRCKISQSILLRQGLWEFSVNCFSVLFHSQNSFWTFCLLQIT